jgi:hypothetical protein
MAATAIDVTSSSDRFRSQSKPALSLRSEQKRYAARITCFGALLALTVTIVAGLSVDRLMAAHGLSFEQALVRAVQFDGDPAFLAP